MKYFLMKVSLGVMLTLTAFTTASATGEANEDENFDWNPVMDAIIQVESGGNARAVSGNSVGVMQITPVCVKQCNIILQQQKSKKRYTLADRYDPQKSREMFLLIQQYYNPSNNVEYAIRSWNGGNKYSVKATNGYYKKVMSNLKTQELSMNTQQN